MTNASPFTVGLTGGIASGKSVVSRYFAELGITVVDADVIARDIVAPGTPALAQIVARFGSQMLDAAGHLDRSRLRAYVFADEGARQALNAITHPAIAQRLHDDCLAGRSAYVIAAIPLLVEGGGRQRYPWLQRVLVVDTDENTQSARLCQRDGIDTTLAQHMIAAQATRTQRLALADDVITNHQDLAALHAQIERLDRCYRTLAS